MEKLKKAVKDFIDEDERSAIVVAALKLDDDDVEAMEFVSQTGSPVLLAYVHRLLERDLEKKGLIKKKESVWSRGYFIGSTLGLIIGIIIGLLF